MPKRVATPPLEDVFKYLSVMNPYPRHVLPTIEEELLLFARWVTSCIPQDDLTAVFYRPASPNLLIIEVLKTCSRVNNFLGAHSWREFLKNPTDADVNQSSRVYYCRFSSDREVQKHGWKRLDGQECWFKDYNPREGIFKIGDDYPKTKFCEAPHETQAEFAPCRPLPVSLFPRGKPKPVNRVIVPGSEQYLKAKEDGTYAKPKVATPQKASWSAIAAPKPSRASSAYTPSVASSHSSETESVRVVVGQNSFLPNSWGPPPGLSAPPGLFLPANSVISASSSEVDSEDFEPSAHLIVQAGSPGVASDVDITKALEKLEINSRSDSTFPSEDSDGPWANYKDPEGEDAENLWKGGQPKRPTDWDKIICPVHKVKCSGTCIVYSKLKNERKREQERKEGMGNGNGKENEKDGWRTPKAKGRGRGKNASSNNNVGYGRSGGWH